MLGPNLGRGKGGQCGAKPQASTDFCRRHGTEEERTHGVATEAKIPEAQLRKFRQAAKVFVIHFPPFSSNAALLNAKIVPLLALPSSAPEHVIMKQISSDGAMPITLKLAARSKTAALR